MRYLILVVVFFTLTANTLAQDSKLSKLNTAIETLKSAMVSADENLLQSIVSEELSYGHSNGLLENKKEFIANLVSKQNPFIEIKLTDQTITSYGKTAIVRHNLFANTINNGNPSTVKLKILLVFKYVKGKWLLLARQAVKV